MVRAAESISVHAVAVNHRASPTRAIRTTRRAEGCIAVPGSGPEEEKEQEVVDGTALLINTVMEDKRPNHHGVGLEISLQKDDALMALLSWAIIRSIEIMDFGREATVP